MPFYTIAIFLTLFVGMVLWYILPTLLIGYASGIALGVIVVLALVRKLGNRAKYSLIASDLFCKITKYKAAIYHIHPQQPQNNSVTVYGEANNYAQLVEVLKGLKFQAPIAKEAAQYAMDTVGNKTLEDKITVALQYLGSDGHREGAI